MVRNDEQLSASGLWCVALVVWGCLLLLAGCAGSSACSRSDEPARTPDPEHLAPDMQEKLHQKYGNF